MVKIQVTDVNDNRPSFYPREYNVSLREGDASSSATTPVVIVAATDPDSGRFGSISFRIVAGNEAGLFRIDKNTGEIFVSRPSLLSTRTQPYHRLNISATDGGGLKSLHDAEVFISIIDSTQRPPIFLFPRYTYAVREDVSRDTVIGSVKASVRDYGKCTPPQRSCLCAISSIFFLNTATINLMKTEVRLITSSCFTTPFYYLFVVVAQFEPE